MRRLLVSLVAGMAIVTNLMIAGCAQAAPPGKSDRVPAAPSKAAAPTTVAQPTTAPTVKIDFPVKGKVITLIVAYPAGGTVDFTGRLLASQLEKELGTVVQVVNRPGAGSQVGITELVRSKPDGYTIGYTPIPSTITIYLDPERKAVFTRKDIQPVANHVVEPDVMAVSADSPYKTLKDVIDAARAKPDKVTVGFTGLMSHQHLAILQLEKVAGVKFAIVSFDGSAPALSALLGRHIDVQVADQGIFMSQVRSGGVRILGIMDKEESKYLPGVRTFESQGYPVYMGTTRFLSVPAGTPKGVVDTLSAAIKRVLDTEEHQQKLEAGAFTVRYMDPAQIETVWTEMEAQIKPLVELTGK